MAGNVVGKAEYQLGADLKPLVKDLGLAENQLKKSGKVAESAFAKFKKDALTGFGLGGGMVAFSAAQKAVGMLTNEVGGAITAASDLAESQSKVDQVFTTSAATIHDWARGAADGFGLSQQAALEAAGTFGNFTQALGITEDASVDMSRSLIELAADLASFNNQSIDEVLGALRSGLAGEAEPMRRLGADISAARIEALLLADGIEKVNGKFSESDKVQARYRAIMADTVKAQGDFARTSDGLANSQRILDARVEDLRASLGQKLTPAAGLAVDAFKGMVDVIGILAGDDDNDPMLERLRDHFRKVAEAATDAAASMEGDWAGAGTIFDSALDGLNAVNDLFNSSPLAPPLVTQTRAMMDALRPFTTALGLTEQQLKLLAHTAVTSGATVEQAVEAIRKDWALLTSGEQTRFDNYYKAFILPLKKTVGEEAPAVVKSGVREVMEGLSELAPGMRRTINQGRSDVAQAMRQLRWAMEHPFAGDKYANFLKDKQEAANRKLTRAIKTGNTDAAREAAALVAAIHAELAKLEDQDFSVHVGMEYDPLSSIQAPTAPSGGKKPRRKGKRKDGAFGASYLPGDYGLVGEFAMERIVNVGGIARVEPIAGAGRGGNTYNVAVHLHGNGFLGQPEDAQRLARQLVPPIRRELDRLALKP